MKYIIIIKLFNTPNIMFICVYYGIGAGRKMVHLPPWNRSKSYLSQARVCSTVLRQNSWTGQHCMENSLTAALLCRARYYYASQLSGRTNTIPPAVLNKLNLKQQDKPQTGSRSVSQCLQTTPSVRRKPKPILRWDKRCDYFYFWFIVIYKFHMNFISKLVFVSDKNSVLNLYEWSNLWDKCKSNVILINLKHLKMVWSIIFFQI